MEPISKAEVGYGKQMSSVLVVKIAELRCRGLDGVKDKRAHRNHVPYKYMHL